MWVGFRSFFARSARVCGVLVAVALSLAGAGAGRADVPASVAAAAKAEGTIVWYSALDDGTLNGAVALFNRTHPGIVLKALRLGSAQIPPRVMTERTAGKYNADVVSCDQLTFSQLAQADVFQRVAVANPSRYLRGTIDPKGQWVAFYTDTTAIAWNPERLKADGLKPPVSLADLARPEWRGKVGIDSTAFNWYQSVLATQKNGKELLKRIADNKPFITSGHSATITQLISGEFDATPTAYGYMAERARLAGQPIDFTNPRPVAVGLELAAIMKNAPHPNGARVLVDWLLSKPAQQFFADDGRTPTLGEIKADARVFNPAQPYYIPAAPGQTEFQDLVSSFKALLGIAS